MPDHQQVQQSKKTNTIFQKQTAPVSQTPVSNPYSIIQRAKINPKSLTHADIMQLQRTIGNQAVGRLLSGIGNSSTAQQATVQRQEIPEEEEPFQGKMMQTIQRQEIPEEEEPLQGKMIETVQRQEIPEEEEPLQGKMIGTIQRQEIPEEEEPLQGKFTKTVQRQEIPEEEPLQTKRENNTGMPDHLKAGVENLSGIDLSDVKVHYNSDKPANVGALAYTQGTDIHVAPAQEKHLPHEAWHVVQQKQGRVQPTMQLKGLAVNDDVGLEREADVMGKRSLMGSVRSADLANEQSSTIQQRSVVVQRILAHGIGDEEYQKEAEKNLRLETEIGMQLICDANLTEIAGQIRLYSGSPMFYNEMTEEDQGNLAKLVGPIGGARDLREDKYSLDAHVLATHLKIDRKEHHDPFPPDPNRRQNLFNIATSQQNPIFPWNIHEFDMPLHEVTRWADYPKEIKELITERWNEYRHDEDVYARVCSFQSLGRVIGISSLDAEEIIGYLQPDERQTFLYDILNIKWSTSRDTLGESLEETSRMDNPLGPEMRQHNTGYYANVVRGEDPLDHNLRDWISGAIANKKPVISGPSGHTLRYLNHWAMLRKYFILQKRTPSDLNKSDIPDPSGIPSLQEARLVMMANLMPPKNHHSYHEVMSASIGITDGVETLEYKYPKSYDDLLEMEIGKEVLQKAYSIINNPISRPIPNPWNGRIQSGFTPPTTVDELVQRLYQYGSNIQRVELILSSVNSSLRTKLIPRVDLAFSEGNITLEQRDLVLNTIQRLESQTSYLPKSDIPDWGF